MAQTIASVIQLPIREPPEVVLGRAEPTERIINMILKDILYKIFKDFIICGKESSSQSKYSRFHSSLEDFSVYYKDDQNDHLAAAAITATTDDDDLIAETAEMDLVMEEVDCLYGSSGESKLHTRRRYREQLIANMIKKAGDLAYRNIKSSKLIYGMLLDYKIRRCR